ncbi:hypothetical protein MLD38_002456 [Melastoma candidum]|uniref:Uncharacterized protein n=1 Tax=Melastoma candidum TaxID=119954 RepID=A0ACB9RZM4_9MYRT|nr:hypothetical protein MLD38_002456 [Melastoma candidum]
MEDQQHQQLNPLAITHLLQQTLRSICLHENSQWVYAVFWRILPRNYPPPKWDSHGGYERSRGNRRNWILVWEDGFCNFAASTAVDSGGDGNGPGDRPSSSSSGYGSEFPQYQGLQPELFFKMSHEIYNYGEGVIGKVAADYSHKWIHKEPPNEHEINFLSSWHNSADSFPRTWEAQFQAGIKTIALIAVREGVVQLGAINKVAEDLSYVVLIRKRFGYIESIPGVLLPHPSSAPFPHYVNPGMCVAPTPDAWHFQHHAGMVPPMNAVDMCEDPFGSQQQQHQPVIKITPSMSSLEALLSKLPAVMPPPPPPQQESPHFLASPENRATTLELITAKQEIEEEYYRQPIASDVLVGESSGSMRGGYHHHHYQHHIREPRNDTSSAENNGYSD